MSIISVTEITDEVNRCYQPIILMKNMKRVGNKLYQGTISNNIDKCIYQVRNNMYEVYDTKLNNVHLNQKYTSYESAI